MLIFGYSLTSCVSGRCNRIGPICVYMCVCSLTFQNTILQRLYRLCERTVKCSTQEMHEHWGIFIYYGKLVSCIKSSSTVNRTTGVTVTSWWQNYMLPYVVLSDMGDSSLTCAVSWHFALVFRNILVGFYTAPRIKPFSVVDKFHNWWVEIVLDKKKKLKFEYSLFSLPNAEERTRSFVT